MSKVKVIDCLSNNILLETSIEDIDTAYSYAKEMESYGLVIKIEIPSVSETLIRSLGATNADVESLKQGLDDEIASHDSSCCHTPEDKD